MAKKKPTRQLTKKQHQRVLENKQKKFSSQTTRQNSGLLEGKVIKHLGHDLSVKTTLGVLLCKVQKTVGSLCVGDKVFVAPDGNEQDRGVVVDCLPRENTLTRPRPNKPPALLASNLNQMVIVLTANTSMAWPNQPR